MTEEIIGGLHAVLTAIKENPERIAGLWISSDRADQRIGEVLAAAQTANIKFQRVPRAKLDDLAGELRHQGVVARLRVAPVGNEADLAVFLKALPDQPLLLVLDGVQDPHNLGACLRVADAAGVHAIILPRDKSAPLSAVARRAACGAAETVTLFEVVNLARSLRLIKDAGVWLVGASHDAPETLYGTDLKGPMAFVLGGEGQGLRRLTREHCDILVRIPMAGTVPSLNVSVATGICLFEAMRQRGGGS
ncbi:MAG: 23S rRNA (guanosine(2251)-2'-O)-methyltransferase RlmB [Gammaproteobacteria bacterium]|nr:23S rRNA (guanosine(2251)-2'-O)-methyltransferase RlmB [Gammaproteobacteria bacterium]